MSPRPPSPAAVTIQQPAKTFQWMASGEAAALSRQSYAALTAYALARAGAHAIEGVVLVDGATLAEPRWAPCGARPLAVVLDMDETAILNTGANYDTARRGDPPFDPARWDAWERDDAAYVDAVPGAVEAVAALRAAGITPVFISNRLAAHAAESADALARIGLGPVTAETMLLRETGAGGGKDGRRASVAARWCVVAMIGDQLGDFSDLFNAKGLAPRDRRRLAQSPAIAARWGRGWFLVPNPLYGPGVAGTLDEVFPDKRWPGPKETR